MKVRFFEHTYFTDYLSAKPILVDLGACTGEFTHHFASLFPKAQAIMIEPLPRNFDVIQETANLKKIHGAIVGTPQETITFFEDVSSTQGGSATVNYFKGIEHTVPAFTLKEIFSQYDKIDLCKIDIEGGEWDVILNADDETLQKVVQYTIEFHDFLDPTYIDKTEYCIDRLTSLGFKHESIGTDWMNGSPYYDMIFYKD